MRVDHFVQLCALFGLLVGLPACLEQTRPTTQSGAWTPIVGMVVMEDMSGVQQGAGVYGLFAEYQEPKQAFGRRIIASDLRGEKCEVKISAVPQEERARENSLIHVGPLSYGLALQKTLSPIEFSEESGEYFQTMDPGIPSGLYRVKGEGTQKYPGFDAILNVPETLEAVKLNGDNFGEGNGVLLTGETVRLSWKAPYALNDNSVMMFDFLVKQEANYVRIVCQAKESDFKTAEKHWVWDIDAKWFADIAAPNIGAGYFVRAVQEQHATDRVALKFQGIRTVSGVARIFQEN